MLTLAIYNNSRFRSILNPTPAILAGNLTTLNSIHLRERLLTVHHNAANRRPCVLHVIL